MEELYRALNDVIECIKESQEYKMCIRIKKQMSENKELIRLIDNVKQLQKKYIKSNYDSSIKKELDKKNKELEEIPIYVVYLQNLEMVNEKIDYVKDSMNDYFYNLFNEK